MSGPEQQMLSPAGNGWFHRGCDGWPKPATLREGTCDPLAQSKFHKLALDRIFSPA